MNKVYVYVLDKNGKALMPTTRYAYVRILLNQGKAKVVKTKPFTIQLLYDAEEAKKENQLILGIDPGRTNVGLCAVDDEGHSLFAASVETRNKDVPKLMKKRKTFRIKHRQTGRRLVKVRRAKASGAVSKDGIITRRLPKCEENIELKHVKNKEARFFNRKREEGWFTPTAWHLLRTMINLVLQMEKILPVTDIVIELNKFAFMAMDNPNIKRWQYQKGPLYGKGSVDDAVYEQQEGKCLLCGGDIEEYHHIVPRHLGGSDTIHNKAGVCGKCHHLVHTDSKAEAKLKSLKEGMNKKYHALSVLNQIMPYFLSWLEARYPGHVYVTDGRSTKQFRDDYAVEKDHYADAYCIACSVLDIETADPPEKPYRIRQFRRHDRQACHKDNYDRKYVADSKVLATNRHKRIEQKTDSLEEYRLSHNDEDISKLTVKKTRAAYKDMKRIMPGAVMKNVKTNSIFTLQRYQGRHNGTPDYYISTDGDWHIASKCIVLINNTGLVFV